uniref:FERM domain-containing protein n=1 Tax=Hydrogenobacter sp. TaxID=2152829 RepID=A0A7C2ZPM6_9AQUI
MAFRRLLFILFLFLSGTYANTLHEIDENKLKEFIKNTFSNYRSSEFIIRSDNLFEKPFIVGRSKNLILVHFASMGATTDLTVLLIYKDNNFQVAKIKDGDKYKDAIFLVCAGGAGRYSHNVKLEEKLKVYEYSIYGKKEDYCRAKVYDFDGKFFVINDQESTIESKNYCRKVCKELDIKSKACMF